MRKFYYIKNPYFHKALCFPVKSYNYDEFSILGSIPDFDSVFNFLLHRVCTIWFCCPKAFTHHALYATRSKILWTIFYYVLQSPISNLLLQIFKMRRTVIFVVLSSGMRSSLVIIKWNYILLESFVTTMKAYLLFYHSW